MVERLNGIEKVRGSTPLISTNHKFCLRPNSTAAAEQIASILDDISVIMSLGLHLSALLRLEAQLL